MNLLIPPESARKLSRNIPLCLTMIGSAVILQSDISCSCNISTLRIKIHYSKRQLWFQTMKLASLKPLLSAHYILNPVACLLYVILKTFQPFCVWLFPDDECQMSWVSKVVQYNILHQIKRLMGFFSFTDTYIRSRRNYVLKFQRILPSTAKKKRHFEAWVVHERRNV